MGGLRSRNSRLKSAYKAYQKAFEEVTGNIEPGNHNVPRMLEAEFWLNGDLSVFTRPRIRMRTPYFGEQWNEPTTRKALLAWQEIQCNREELARLTVEAQRLCMWMNDEPNYIRHRISLKSSGKGIHWPWTIKHHLQQHKQNPAVLNEILDTLDIWYAQERLQELDRRHVAIEHDMGPIAHIIPTWSIANGRRQDLGRGSPWHERHIPAVGDPAHVSIPPNMVARWQTHWMQRGLELPNMADEWDNEELQELEDGYGNTHITDTDDSEDMLHNLGKQVLQADEEMDDDELMEMFGLTAQALDLAQ